MIKYVIITIALLLFLTYLEMNRMNFKVVAKNNNSLLSGKITHESPLLSDRIPYPQGGNNHKTNNGYVVAIDTVWNLYQRDTAIFYKGGKNSMVITHYYENRLRK